MEITQRQTQNPKQMNHSITQTCTCYQAQCMCMKAAVSLMVLSVDYGY